MVVALLADTALVRGRPSTFGTLASSVLLLFAAYGLGSALERVVVRRGTRAGVGLLVAWGLAVLLGLAGWLVLMHSASVGAARVLAVGGLGLGVWRASEPGVLPALRRWRWPEVVVGAGLVTAALVRCAGLHGVRGEGFRWDDAPAYLPLVSQLAQTGSMAQELCLRRLVSLGGQTFLQVFQLAGGGSVLGTSNVFDWGTCSLVLVVLVLSLPAEGRGQRAARLLAAVLVLTLPYSRWNTAAGLSGVVFLVAAWQTDTWARAEHQPRVALVVTPLLVAALCTLRNNYLVVGGLYLLLRAMGFRVTRVPWKRAFRDAAIAGGLVFGALLPWMIESYRLFATPFYPIVHGGTVAAATGLVSHPPLAQRANALVANLTYSHATFGVAVIAVAAAAALLRRTRAFDPTKMMLASYGLGYLVQWWMLPAIDPLGHTRYAFASVAATILVIVASAGRVRRFAALDLVLCVAVVALHLAEREQVVSSIMRVPPESRRDPQHRTSEADESARAVSIERAQSQRYAALQRACAPGETILAMLDEPYRLDFRRNSIIILEFPGALGLGGPPPVLGPAPGVVEYFRARGVRYVAFTKPTRAKGVYARAAWETLTDSTDPVWTTHKAMSPYWLGAIAFMDALEVSEPTVFEDERTVVVDLWPR